ncbi:MAG: response regulator [Verrucomicrobia bacterium]|nr:response regulator [Verrucomicrobiota bacterium]
MTPSVDRRCVLVVDDDLISRRYIERSLEKFGYEARLATGVLEAQALMNEIGFAKFDCVLTDFQMPEHNGLVLLKWLQRHAPELAAILITATGEKDIVTQSLRGGACDFLDKPVESTRLRSSIARAIELTDRRRHLAATESAALEIGRVQQRMITPCLAKHPSRMNYFFHPKHQAGGDFITAFELGDGQVLALAADVSGHDLKAAFVSAYFQGIVRGMIERKTPVREIFDFFNRFLIKEWNIVDPACSDSASSMTSLSVCGVLFDERQQIATLNNSGFPSPLHIDDAGVVNWIGHGSSPLGWFDDSLPNATTVRTDRGGCLYLWSDGLEDFALASGLSPAAVAFRLFRATDVAERRQLLALVGDDISIIRFDLNQGDQLGTGFQPLVAEKYAGDKAHAINALQAGWEKSLRYALPGLPEDKLFDLLLCAREVLLNAMQHGCGGRADQFCSLQVACDAVRQTMRVRITDPGPGFEDAYLEKTEATTDAFKRHCGLILVKNLPDRVSVTERGTSICMDFVFPASFDLKAA